MRYGITHIDMCITEKTRDNKSLQQNEESGTHVEYAWYVYYITFLKTRWMLLCEFLRHGIDDGSVNKNWVLSQGTMEQTEKLIFPSCPLPSTCAMW